jgi:ATP-dependent DNA ligase
MPFETLVGLVKKKTYNAQILEVKFHVFDCVVPEISFEDRLWLLDQVFDQSLARTVDLAPDTVRRVETRECQSEEYIPSLLEAQLIEGYEGIMLRNKAAPYVHKRTHDLQKVKKFVDAEFEIVGYERENNAARSIVWSCRTASGRSFAARPTGVLASRSLTDKVARAQVGKMLTVKYQELTAHGVPRFPVGIAVRDYE